MPRCQSLWVFQQLAKFRPDGCFNEFITDCRIVADSFLQTDNHPLWFAKTLADFEINNLAALP